MLESIISVYRYLFIQLTDFVGIGWSIVLLSFITSAIMIPIMKIVAGCVKRETEYQDVILPQVAEIKLRYSSDAERHLHISRLYARYGYSPLFAIRKVLPLFVQLPFLFLTYYMLNGTKEINDVSFFVIRDLGQPDGLLAVFEVNVLPLIMTVVNIITVFATVGFTRRDQIQSISIAIIFLIILYTSPAALLLYWTINNVITCIRTLTVRRCEGAQLLLNRMLALRGFTSFVKKKSTVKNLAILLVVLLLISLYMRLMVYMEIWFFNRFASYWLMNEVLAIASFVSYIIQRNANTVVRCFALFGVIASSIVGVIVLTSLVMLPFAPRLMMLINQNCDLSNIFDVLFLIGMLPIVICGIADFRGFFKAFIRGFAKAWYWLLAIVILSIHYSFSSHNFKLPVDSIFLLTIYLILPTIAISLFCTLLGYRYVSTDKLFKVGVGVAIGAYLIPMISLEEGKLLGYSSNLIIRLVLMGLVSCLILRIKNQKRGLVFLLLLGGVVVTNAIIFMCRYSTDMNLRQDVAIANDVRQALLTAPLVKTNSIYLLVYDGYAHDIVLDGMQIKSVGIRQYLNERGFTSYEAYSVGSDTIVSMGNAFYLGGVVQGSVRSSMVGNNVFCDYLRKHGYSTSYVLSAYDMPNRGERMPGDFYFPTVREMVRPEMVLYPCIIRGILSQSPNTFNSYTCEEWLAVKRSIMLSATATRQFMYAHSERPGHVVANPAYRKSFEAECKDYERRLALADQEIKEDVEKLLAKDDDALIIIASDHGSMLSLPRQESEYDAFTMLDRVGVQLHVRWPRDYKPCLTLNCLQNLFLEIQIYLSGDTSLSRYAVKGETLRIQAPLRAPAGSIVDGVIKKGVDKGLNLFDAAKVRASRMNK